MPTATKQHIIHLSRREAFGIDLNRRASRSHCALCINAELHQAIDKVLDGTLAHALHTVQHKPGEAGHTILVPRAA